MLAAASFVVAVTLATWGQVGMLLAASTGVIGATVVTLGLLSLPVLLKHGYSVRLATGTICAAKVRHRTHLAAGRWRPPAPRARAAP